MICSCLQRSGIQANSYELNKGRRCRQRLSFLCVCSRYAYATLHVQYIVPVFDVYLQLGQQLLEKNEALEAECSSVQNVRKF